MALCLLYFISFTLKDDDLFDVHSCPKFNKLWLLFNRLVMLSCKSQFVFDKNGCLSAFYECQIF